MSHRPLAPVFAGLRIGLHVLFAALVGLVAVRILLSGAAMVPLALTVLLAAVYGVGAWVARRGRSRAGVVWVLILTGVWAILVVSVPEAAYLVFPLFFLYLHVLPGVTGPLAVVGATALTVGALALHGGMTVGGVVGPVVGAGVALLIGLGYSALERRAAEREELMSELLATRDRLAAAEREQGTLAERARLAREIHDTVAQGLSSIQMLLHAAERADATGPGIEHVRLARRTAAEGLAETRRFIRELAPPSLARGLGAALERLARDWGERTGVEVAVEVDQEVDLPMDAQTALLRIAQGALANVDQHAVASSVCISLAGGADAVRLTVTDDGRGFDPGTYEGEGRTDSFGLRAMRERVEQLGGEIDVASGPGAGTVVAVILPREVPS